MNRLTVSLESLCQHVTMLALVVALFASPAFAEDATDVTSVVTAAVKENKLVIAVDNQTFGDTAPGVPKKLRVEYRIGDEKLVREANEGSRIEISVPAEQKFVVTKAVYGPADDSKPANISKPEELLETLPGFKIEHVLRADPKLHGSWINLVKDPKGRLLLGGQRNQPIARLTLDDGKIVKEELLQIPVTETMGLCERCRQRREVRSVSLQGHQRGRQLRRCGTAARVARRRRGTWCSRDRAGT